MRDYREYLRAQIGDYFASLAAQSETNPEVLAKQAAKGKKRLPTRFMSIVS